MGLPACISDILFKGALNKQTNRLVKAKYFSKYHIYKHPLKHTQIKIKSLSSYKFEKKLSLEILGELKEVSSADR